MICIVDVGRIDLYKSRGACAGVPFMSKLIGDGKSDLVRRERIGSYLALKLTYEKLYGTSMPSLYKDSFGKVHFKENDECNTAPSFNISHSCGVCAIFFSDPDALAGVDIEKCDSSRACEKIEKRFLNNVNNYLQIPRLDDQIIYYAELSDDGERLDVFMPVLSDHKNRLDGASDCFTDTSTDVRGHIALPCSLTMTVAKEYSFFKKWTATEALLKADGRGFSALSSLDEIARHSRLTSYQFRLRDDQFIVSAVLLKKM